MGAQRNAAAPVIIKRKKNVVGGGHHGGAWKVAYADFVTAMMAFFMLMWLLNATTEKQRKGLADYFSPSIPISRVSGGGDGMFGGEEIRLRDPLASARAGGMTAETGTRPATAAPAVLEEFAETLSRIEEDLQARSGESMTSASAARHIVTRVSDEGLIVEIFDTDEEPIFEGDTDQPTALGRDLAALVARVFGLAANPVAVAGHVRAYPEVLRDNPGWDLSTARALAMRGLLETGGIGARRLERVSGFSDRKPAAENPADRRNNRIELILLRQDV